MIFTVWESDGCTTIINSVCPSDTDREAGAGSVLRKTIHAKSYNDAMRQFYEWKGWGPYQPMLDENGKEYAEDTIDLGE